MTFSPRRTATKSMCSMIRRIGSIWTALVSASWLLPSMSSSSSALAPPCLSAIIVSWPGRVDVHGVVAVAVDDRGDLVVAADPARGALAELGAGLGGDLLGGHAGGAPLGAAGPGASTRSRRHTALEPERPPCRSRSPESGLPRRGNRSSLTTGARDQRIRVAWARALPDPRRGPGPGRPALRRVLRPRARPHRSSTTFGSRVTVRFASSRAGDLPRAAPRPGRAGSRSTARPSSRRTTARGSRSPGC